MKATVAVSKETYGVCGKCGGDGYISSYSHIKAGVCFSCSGTGKRLVNIEVTERPMDYSELVDALSIAGFPIINTTTGEEENFFSFMSYTEAEIAALTAGAKALLESIP